uniref:Deoxynucleotidyltransferase terminal-interacting protein 1 n=1 Tax=Poecilia reticulata TaxID=8081 RepID=A0A3P9PLA3_POERE
METRGPGGETRGPGGETRGGETRGGETRGGETRGPGGETRGGETRGPGRRSHTAVSYTDPQVSMDLLRAVLQPSFNDDIMAVFRKYQKFFEKAAENVKENVGKDVQTDQLIREACRNVLEHVRSLPVSSHSSPLYPHSPGSVIVKPKAEPVKREGPKVSLCAVGWLLPPSGQWDPSRLNDGSMFVLGSRANKALGMGGTRGRIYIKHSDLFKYAADAKDKQWLAERHHMRATGGKMAYLLIEEDILDLSRSDEYRDCPDVRMDELKPFGVPPWMVEKMQRAMEAQRDNEP